MYYYHGTSTARLEPILAMGLQPRGETLAEGERPGVYLATRPAQALRFAYYAVSRHGGGRPVVLRIRAEVVNAQSLPGVCVEDLGQVFCAHPIPPDAIEVGRVTGLCDDCAQGAWWACSGCSPEWVPVEEVIK